MKAFVIVIGLLIGQVQQTESIAGVYYPQVEEVDCFTDQCLEEGEVRS